MHHPHLTASLYHCAFKQFATEERGIKQNLIWKSLKVPENGQGFFTEQFLRQCSCPPVSSYLPCLLGLSQRYISILNISNIHISSFV